MSLKISIPPRSYSSSMDEGGNTPSPRNSFGSGVEGVVAFQSGGGNDDQVSAPFSAQETHLVVTRGHEVVGNGIGPLDSRGNSNTSTSNVTTTTTLTGSKLLPAVSSSLTSANSAAATALGALGYAVAEEHFEPARYSCLVCVMEDLRQTSSLLGDMVEFWTNMDHLYDARLRLVEMAETYLSTQGLELLMEKGLAVIFNEGDFWRAFSFLCSRYKQVENLTLFNLAEFN